MFENTALRDNTCMLVQITNCVATKPHGLSRTLANTYPYGCPYSKRRPINGRNCAVVSDRAKPGQISIENNEGKPQICNLFAHFYMGYPNGLWAKRAKENKNNDRDLLKGIGNDTEENRLLWFNEALCNLEAYLKTEIGIIDKVVVPYMIGCGLGGGDWNRYKNILKEFSVKLKKSRPDINVILAVPPKKMDRQQRYSGYCKRNK